MKKIEINTIIRIALITYFLSIGKICFSQNMESGFKMLENGSFSNAEVFFEDILSQYPDNKTASICYGRAVGLSGNPSKSLIIFDKLCKTYPNDLEVMLNQSEAYLWIKDGEKAVTSYLQLLTQDPNLFAAVLGLANSYSMTKDYSNAYQFILKAESIQPHNNQVANSKKYIILGLSNQLASEKNAYNKALDLVNLNLKRDSVDQQSLNLKATIFLIAGRYQDALKVYKTLSLKVDALIGQSIAYHLMDENKNALLKAMEALNNTESMDKEKCFQVQSNYMSALLWNNKVLQAKQYSETLLANNSDNLELKLSQAQIAIYESNYTQGINDFSEYLEHIPNSFNANLGKADANHALGMDNEAYHYAFKTLQFFPGQKDASQFVSGLNATHSVKGEVKYSYAYSSDGSSNSGYQLSGYFSLSPLVLNQLTYVRKNLFSNNGNSSVTESFTYSGSKRFTPSVRFMTSIGIVKTKNGDTEHNINQQNVNLMADLRISKDQTLKVGYYNEIQDFNEALLKQNLKVQHAVIKNSFFWKLKGLGSYTEAYRSHYSDGNTRNLVFTSLYKTPSRIQSLKFGVNYQFMNFSNKVLTYYSPKSYNQLEAFTELNFKEGKDLPIGVYCSVAGGYQFVEGMTQSTWRAQIKLNKALGKFNFAATYSYSTIIASETNGFNHTSMDISMTYRFGAKPLFFKKISNRMN